MSREEAGQNVWESPLADGWPLTPEGRKQEPSVGYLLQTSPVHLLGKSCGGRLGQCWLRLSRVNIWVMNKWDAALPPFICCRLVFTGEGWEDASYQHKPGRNQTFEDDGLQPAGVEHLIGDRHRPPWGRERRWRALWWTQLGCRFWKEKTENTTQALILSHWFFHIINGMVVFCPTWSGSIRDNIGHWRGW